MPKPTKLRMILRNVNRTAKHVVFAFFGQRERRRLNDNKNNSEQQRFFAVHYERIKTTTNYTNL